MAVSVTGSKTVTKAPAPHLTAAKLTTILATAVEDLTVNQLRELLDMLSRVSGGGDRNKTIGSFLS